MFEHVTSPDRARLGFEEAVSSSFEFLKRHNFHLAASEPTFVRYESPTVFVNVYHGRASYELGVEVGRLKNAPEKLTLLEIVSQANANRSEGFEKQVNFQASSGEGVRRFLPQLASLLETYGIPFINGEPSAYSSALEMRARASAQFELEQHIKKVRQEAETAWQAKQHDRLLQLYSAIADHLTAVEAKRVAYAERQLGREKIDVAD